MRLKFYFILLSIFILILQFSPTMAQDWENVGPEGLTKGSWNATGQMNVARFHPEYSGTFAIGETPQDPEDLYKNCLIAGSETGGAFISYNGGTDWENMNTDALPYTGCMDFEFGLFEQSGDIITDYFHATSSRSIVYHHQTFQDQHLGSVVYRSEDQGGTWLDCGAPFSINTALDYDGYYNTPKILNDIATTNFDEGQFMTNPNGEQSKKYAKAPEKIYTIYVASNMGVHYSEDRGVTWTQSTFNNGILPYDNHIRVWNGGPGKIVIDWSDNKNIWLSGRHEASRVVGATSSPHFDKEADRIYYSDDAGSTFKPWWRIFKYNNTFSNLKLTSNPNVSSNDVHLDSFKIVETVIHQSPTNANKLVLLVHTDYKGNKGNTSAFNAFKNKFDRVNYDGNFNGTCTSVFFSTNGGATWNFSGVARRDGPYYNLFSSQIDVINDNLIYFGRGNTGKVSRFTLNTGVDVNFPGGKRHPDFRDMAMVSIPAKQGPNKGHMLVANDGGMILNRDMHNWVSSQQFTRLQGWGLAIWRGYMVGISQNNAGDFISAGPDNGVRRKEFTSPNNVTWHQTTWGDGEHSKMNQHDDRYYTKIYSGNAAPTQTFRFASPNNCWTGSSTFPNGSKKIFVRMPYESFKSNGLTYFVSNQNNNIIKSNDHGCPPYVEFQTLSGTNIYDIALDEKDNPDLIMYALNNPMPNNTNQIRLAYGFVPKVLPQTSPMVDWKLFNPNNPDPMGSYISDMVITHAAKKPFLVKKHKLKVYASYHGYQSGKKVYSCTWNTLTDTYTNWINESAGLPNTTINCMIYDRCSHALFVGTDQGVYYKNASLTSMSWVKIGTKIPNTTVTELEIQDSSGYIYASTFGRSMWKYDISSLLCAKQSDMPNDTINGDDKGDDKGDGDGRRGMIEDPSNTNSNSIHVLAYPNPTTDVLNIDLRNLATTEIDVKIEITTLEGRTIQSSTVKSGANHQLNMQETPAGIYLLKVSTNQNELIHSEKIVVITTSSEGLDHH